MRDEVGPNEIRTRRMKLSRLAYLRFKENLLAGRIRPGAVISQAELSELVGVPISPLREAMQVLEQEGLLTVMPRSGIRIVKPDLELVRNAFQLRRVIEREAVARFAEQANAGPLDRLEARHRAEIARMEAAEDVGDFDRRAIELDRDLHGALVAALRNPFMSNAYDLAITQIQLVRLDMGYALSAGAVRRTLQEHMRVIEALRRHDAEEAGRAMDEHLTQAMHRAMGV
jgi:DNA-binding GntR family transcriptional regulator